MQVTQQQSITAIINEIDIPDSAYDKAENRYKSVTNWFKSDASESSNFDPHLYPQGSFRLGTVIRPKDSDGEYDLDMGCRLRKGITNTSHTQKELKSLVGRDVESYCKESRIKELKEEKHRCWRLKYADELKFHLDIVPSIPDDAEKIKHLLFGRGLAQSYAINFSKHAGRITDNRLWNFAVLSSEWKRSNSEGFALWFEYRMEQLKGIQERLLSEAKAAKVDKIPTYRWKTPLQRSVQLLKRHRDYHFQNDPDSKPASILITTLAARAYQGETDLIQALDQVLTNMGSFVKGDSPRVENPVDPREDFADRWENNSQLEAKFWKWLRAAQNDYNFFAESHSSKEIFEKAHNSFGVHLDSRKLQEASPDSLLRPAILPPKLSFPNKPIIPNKPSGFAQE